MKDPNATTTADRYINQVFFTCIFQAIINVNYRYGTRFHKNDQSITIDTGLLTQISVQYSANHSYQSTYSNSIINQPKWT